MNRTWRPQTTVVMDVYWLEQCVADVPEQNDWLSTSDLVQLNSMRFEKRRMDWRLGRWTAKLALAVQLHLPSHLHALAEIEIRPALSGAPEAYLAGNPADVTISLSHSAGIAICAIATSGVALGCDLEIIEPRSKEFVTDYFTAEEQEMVSQAPIADRSTLLALLWSAKESALKALREGLRLDTRSVAVTPVHASCRPDWHPLQVRFRDGRVFDGWWQHQDNVLRIMVATPSPSQPIALVSGALLKAPQTPASSGDANALEEAITSRPFSKRIQNFAERIRIGIHSSADLLTIESAKNSGLAQSAAMIE